MESGDWVKVIAKSGPHQQKRGYIIKTEKAYDGYGNFRCLVSLTSDSMNQPLPSSNAMFYDTELEVLPEIKVSRDALIDLSLDIKSQPLFKLLVEEGKS